MHELAITESILEIALRHATTAKAKKVTDIHLVIGRLSSVVDDSVQFYWDMISQGTLCAGAILHFKRLPATMECLDCMHSFTFDTDLIPCPSCGSMRARVISGNEFRLDSLEIEGSEEKA